MLLASSTVRIQGVLPSAVLQWPRGANGQANTYDRAQVRLNAARAKAHPNPKLASVDLKPGMTATVDIRTGQRSVLKYLAKPVYKAFGGALNER